MTISTTAPSFPSAPEVPWVTSDEGVRVPNTSMLPGSTSSDGSWQPARQQAADAAGNGGDSEPRWTDSVRAMVRSSPLAAMIGALVLGIVVSRVVR
jgi:hypothetical protein